MESFSVLLKLIAGVAAALVAVAVTAFAYRTVDDLIGTLPQKRAPSGASPVIPEGPASSSLEE